MNNWNYLIRKILISILIYAHLLLENFFDRFRNPLQSISTTSQLIIIINPPISSIRHRTHSASNSRIYSIQLLALQPREFQRVGLMFLEVFYTSLIKNPFGVWRVSDRQVCITDTGDSISIIAPKQ